MERALIETFGKYTKYAEPGFQWIIPIIQRMYKVNITEKMIDAKAQEIITKDRLNATVDAQVYLKVKPTETTVKNSQYNAENYEYQLVNLARTTLRNIIGNLTYEESNSDREKINVKLQKVLEKEAAPWGVEILRTELKQIDPPSEVQTSMNEVVKAENLKQAAVDQATAKETEADGYKRAEIKKAEGIKRSKILVAEGAAKAFNLVNKSFKGNAQKLKQLEVTQASLQENSKIIITEKGVKPNLILGQIPTKEQ